MTVSSRADVASSFTIIKGAMIEETYAVFAAWDLTRSKRENLDRLRDENFIGAGSTTWLRDVAKVLNRRFDPAGRDLPLVTLAKGGCDLEVWKPVLMWHMTRDEFLLRDFLQCWLYPSFSVGTFRIRTGDVELYLQGIKGRGASTEHDWAEHTIKRVAAGLLKLACDFGLVRGAAAREFASFHLPESSFIYLLHALRDEQLSPSKVLSAPDWHMFLMSRSDVERELLRLHQFRKLDYQVAGSLIELSLPCSNAREYAQRMVA